MYGAHNVKTAESPVITMLSLIITTSTFYFEQKNAGEKIARGEDHCSMPLLSKFEMNVQVLCFESHKTIAFDIERHWMGMLK